MPDKIEITIDVIIHATEDPSKIFAAFKETFDLDEENFTINNTVGHYENPIIMLKVKIIKKQAQVLLKKLLDLLKKDQIMKLIEEIDERTVDSRFHFRLDKQELINGNVIINERGMIKIKIHTPIYNKKDKIQSFTKIFQIAN
ncbi:RNA-binding domain-containing protein [Nitrosopumilus sp.]|uniref:RNA-binding domain-containing protein n=1 Tax=Nitrosopumilus sp. TaxID=2024843 RepID=UPI003B5C201F